MKKTLSSLKNMFKVPDLRNKIIFTLVIICIYRLGLLRPAAGIDFKAAAVARGGVDPRAGCSASSTCSPAVP